MDREPYQTDMDDKKWGQLDLFLSFDYPGRGRRPDTPLREVVNAMLYRWHTGCGWRMLPHDFPPWRTVYEYHRRWSSDGRMKRIEDVLKPRRCKPNVTA